MVVAEKPQQERQGSRVAVERLAFDEEHSRRGGGGEERGEAIS